MIYLTVRLFEQGVLLAECSTIKLIRFVFRNGRRFSCALDSRRGVPDVPNGQPCLQHRKGRNGSEGHR